MKKILIAVLLFLLFTISANAAEINSEIGGSSEKTLYSFLNSKGMDLNNVDKIVFNNILSTGKAYEYNSFVDISKQQNNSIIAFVIDDTLYIQFNGTLLLNNDSSFLFYANNNSFSNIAEINGLEYISPINSTNLSYMFSGLENVESLNISTWNTSNVVDIQYMFNNMKKLRNLDLSSWNTKKIQKMLNTFNGFESMENLNVSGWNLLKIYRGGGQSPFKNLKTNNLIALNLVLPEYLEDFFVNSDIGNLLFGNSENSSVKNLMNMFYNSNISLVNFNNFNTSNVTSMYGLFEKCNIGTISNLDTSNVTDMNGMFRDSSVLEFDFENLDTSNVTDMSNMFRGFSGLDELSIKKWNVSKVRNMGFMFMGSSFKSLNIGNIDTSNVVYMNNMFGGMKQLTNINLNGFNTSNVGTMEQMFTGCSSLEHLDLSSFDTSKVTNMYNMFGNMKSIKNVGKSSNNDLILGENFKTSNVTKMGYMFDSMDNLNTLDVSGWDLSKLNAKDNNYSPVLRTNAVRIIANGIKLPDNSGSLFLDNKRLQVLEILDVDTSNVTDMSYMFKGCNSLTTLDVSSFNTSNVTDMSHMFYNCSSLKTLDLSNFDTSNVTNIKDMFYWAFDIKTIFVSNKWDLSNIGSNQSIFYDNINLIGSSGTKYNNSYRYKNYAKIDEVNNPGVLSAKFSILSNKYDISSNIIYGDINDVNLDDFIVENVNIAIEDNYINFYYFDKLVKSIEVKSYTYYNNIPNISIELESNNNTITLKWNNSEYAVGYIIYRSLDNKKWTQIGTTEENYYFDKSLTYNKKYYYKIMGYNNVANSNYSNVVAKTIKPNKVELSIKSAGTNNIKLGWEKVSVNGYEVYSSIDQKKWTKLTTITKNDTLEYNAKKLKENKKYYFKVRAFKTTNGKKVYGTYSDVVSTKTAPKKPTLKITLKDYNAMNVSMGETKGATLYRLEKSLDGVNYKLIEEFPVSGKVVSDEQEIGKTYYFRLKACNSDNRCSGWVKAELKQTTKTPGFSLKTSSKKVTITMSKVNAADGYQIYRATSKKGKYSKIKEFNSEVELLEYVNKTTKGKTYYYKVRTFKLNESGQRIYSPYSKVKSIKSK